MSRSVQSLALSLCAVLSLAGCATIIKGGSQKLTFDSSPSGAQVVLNGQPVGVTPLQVPVIRSHNTTVTIRKDGFKEQILNPQTKFNNWFWGNIIFGGLLGSTTDNLTGAVIQYSPDKFYVTLEPADGTTPSAKDELRSQVIRYVLTNLDDLSRDLAAGRGEKLSALFDLLGVPAPDRSAATARLKALHQNRTTDASFAESVANIYAQ